MSDDAGGGRRGTAAGPGGDVEPSAETTSERMISRRWLLAFGLGGAAMVVVGGATALELVKHDVLPGKQFLDSVDGACSVPSPPLEFAPLGPSVSGSSILTPGIERLGTRSAFHPATGLATHFHWW
jgi:hypothetical protein